MILRQYLYIDDDFVNDAFTTINGYDFDQKDIQHEGTAAFQDNSEPDAQRDQSERTITAINANMTLTSKLQAVIEYLNQSSNGEIPYYDAMTKDNLISIRRECFFEGQFKLSFTKIETYAKMAEGIQKLDCLFGTHEANGSEAIEQIQKLATQERERGIPCLLTFLGNKKPVCFAYLNEKCFKSRNIHMLSEVTVLCKVVRIIKVGQYICLTDLSKLMDLRFPDNHQGKKARVEAIKNGELSKIKEFEDRIDGPALEIFPIAIYR